MRTPGTRWLTTALVVLPLLGGAAVDSRAQAPARAGVRADDVHRFLAVGDVQLSPDGGMAA